MNMPIKNKAAFTPSKKLARLVKISASQWPRASGTPARLSKKPNTPALAMMNMMAAVEMAERCSVTDKPRTLMRRYTSMPTTRAYTTATTEASVGVNTPP